jgi:hypothetical protein
MNNCQRFMNYTLAEARITRSRAPCQPNRSVGRAPSPAAFELDPGLRALPKNQNQGQPPDKSKPRSRASDKSVRPTLATLFSRAWEGWSLAT